MTEAATVLEDHAVIVRDGRIVDVLSTAQAAQRYEPLVSVERDNHVFTARSGERKNTNCRRA